MIPPILFLGSMLAATGLAWLAYRVHRGARRALLRCMAAEWQMRFVPTDRFDLAARVAAAIPDREATDLNVVDVVYGTQESSHRYVFTAQYTGGPEDGYRRRQCVMTVCEPKEHGPETRLSPVVVAPKDGSIAEQYEYLKRREWQG